MNKHMVSINVEIDKDIKQKFESICDAANLSAATALNMFVTQVVDRNKFPSFLEIPNHETIKAIQDIENGIGLSREFASIKDLMDDLSDND